eukprot:s972_g4.t1
MLFPCSAPHPLLPWRKSMRWIQHSRLCFYRKTQHSAISNPSDFAEDEEVDYLALELLHHLPAEKADKLMKSLRAKEKAQSAAISASSCHANSSLVRVLVWQKMGCKSSKAAAKPAEAKKEEPKVEPKKEEPKVEEKKSEPTKESKEVVEKKDEPVGEVVDVKKGMTVTNMRRQQSGHVLQHTATDVLVKYDDGKTEWTEIEDLQKMVVNAVKEKEKLPEVTFEGAGDNKGLCSCGFF